VEVIRTSPCCSSLLFLVFSWCSSPSQRQPRPQIPGVVLGQVGLYWPAFRGAGPGRGPQLVNGIWASFPGRSRSSSPPCSPHLITLHRCLVRKWCVRHRRVAPRPVEAATSWDCTEPSMRSVVLPRPCRDNSGLNSHTFLWPYEHRPGVAVATPTLYPWLKPRLNQTGGHWRCFLLLLGLPGDRSC